MRSGPGSEQIQVGAHEVAQPCSLPVLLHHEVLRFRQPLNALIELLHKLVHAFGLASSLQRHPFYDCELVLGAVRKLAHQKRGMFLAAFEFR